MNDLIRGPKWRTVTTPRRRHVAAGVTFAVIVGVGSVVLILVIRFLNWTNAPDWVTTLPWTAPTLATVVWALLRPSPAPVTSDDSSSWLGYATRWAMIGEYTPRPAIVRIITAALFGAPLCWSLVVTGVLILLELL